MIKKRHEVAETLNNRVKCQIHEVHLTRDGIMQVYVYDLTIFVAYEQDE